MCTAFELDVGGKNLCPVTEMQNVKRVVQSISCVACVVCHVLYIQQLFLHHFVTVCLGWSSLQIAAVITEASLKN